MAATHTAQAYSVDARGGPTFKTWSEDVETLSHGVHKGPTCCVRFKFAIWLLTVAALVRCRPRFAGVYWWSLRDEGSGSIEC